MPAPLSSKRRSELRAQAHTLSPLVIIGDKGLTDLVVAEIDRALKAHELIKVRASSGEREQRDIWLEAICERLAAHPVQQIGKVFVIYRENPEDDKAAPKAAKPDVARRGTRGEVVTDRGRAAQRARDAEKQRLRDIADMVRKGKIPPKSKFGIGPPRTNSRSAPQSAPPRGDGPAAVPRTRTASPAAESTPRRRRSRNS